MDEYKPTAAGGKLTMTPTKTEPNRGSHLGENFMHMDASKQYLTKSRRKSKQSVYNSP